MSTNDQSRLSMALWKIRLTWWVSNAIGCAMFALTYGTLMMHVLRDPEIMSSTRQALNDHGFDSSGYVPLSVFSAFSLIMFCLSLLFRSILVKPIKDGLPWRPRVDYQGRAVSRYGTAVTVSSLLLFLIPAAGVPLILFTGRASESLVAAPVFWGLGLMASRPRGDEFDELLAKWSRGMPTGVSSTASEVRAELDCTGMNLGCVRAPGGKLLVNGEELLIRSLLGLLVNT